jgi:hypothetical protein
MARLFYRFMKNEKEVVGHKTNNGEMLFLQPLTGADMQYSVCVERICAFE